MNTPDLLSARGLFEFDRLAIDELARGSEELGAYDGLMPELVGLTAAELSLARLFPYRGRLLPLDRPLPVLADEALLAFLKTDRKSVV